MNRDYEGDIKIEFCKDTAGEWRWRIISRNGNIMAESGEGYKNAIDCYNALDTIAQALGGLPLNGGFVQIEGLPEGVMPVRRPSPYKRGG